MKTTLTFRIRILMFSALVLMACKMHAQEYLTGHLSLPNDGLTKVFYDRTEEIIGNGVFQSTYKVLDAAKRPAYVITLTHNRKEASVNLLIKKQGLETRPALPVQYDKELSALIFSNKGCLDTTFTSAAGLFYLWSFTDTTRDFPVLHKVRLEDGSLMELDPLSKLRIKKQVEMVNAIYKSGIIGKRLAETQRLQQKNNFDSQLVHSRDSMYSKNSYYTNYVTKLKTEVESAAKNALKTATALHGGKKYSGAKKGKNPSGKGILIDDKSFYDGYFIDGKFDNGRAIVHKAQSDYYGGLSGDSLNGPGWLKFTNGAYLLGVFINGTLADGICISKDANGDTYFGNLKNGKRYGYGELRTSSDLFCGEFVNGRLVKGYAKEVDQFNYSSYSKIDNGTKTPIDPQQCKSFFDVIASSHK